MDWLADSLHLVVFYAPEQFSTGAADALQRWGRLFGANPQAYQQSPPGTPPSSQASGDIGPLRATLVEQPVKSELVLHPRADAWQSRTPPAIEDVPAALAKLREYGKKLLIGERLAPVRVGLVVNLSKRMEDAGAAVAEFERNARVQGLPPGANDLTFAFNVRTKLPDTEIQINRLCRWGAATLQIVQMLIGMAAPTTTSSQDLHVATFQIDLNTVPATRPLPLDVPDQALSWLVDEAERIINDGYEYLVAGP